MDPTMAAFAADVLKEPVKGIVFPPAQKIGQLHPGYTPIVRLRRNRGTSNLDFVEYHEALDVLIKPNEREKFELMKGYTLVTPFGFDFCSVCRLEFQFKEAIP